MSAKLLSFIASRNYALLGAGLALGAGFELFKVIHFNIGGISFYNSFKKKQLSKELAEFELRLEKNDQLIAAAHNKPA
ncbi:unnamed protein product, partial [Mesorhabditis spiculigera]